MRAAEAIHVAVFGFLMGLAWMRKLPRERRARATAIGACGLAVNLAAAFVVARVLPARAASVVRDWLPAAMVLLVYWQAGAFFVRVDRGFQEALERIDERVVAPVARWLAGSAAGRWVAGYLELSYLLCYPMVPLSMGALYGLGLRRHADSFWIAVLAPTYVSYCVLPFLQTLPPRLFAEPWLAAPPLTPVRRLNLAILRTASIHANTFPSAHVAASVGSALYLGSVGPWWVGAAFGAIAVGITVGTVAGRYHYAGDAVAACAVAIGVFAGMFVAADGRR